jgi:hypothetical protein
MEAAGVSEHVAAAALPSFLKGPALRLCRHQPRHFPTLIDILLATYASDQSMIEEWAVILQFQMRTGEQPSPFANRLAERLGRLGVDHHSSETKTIFEGGLPSNLQAALRVQYSTNVALRSTNLTQLARFVGNLSVTMGTSVPVKGKALVVEELFFANLASSQSKIAAEASGMDAAEVMN